MKEQLQQGVSIQSYLPIQVVIMLGKQVRFRVEVLAAPGTVPRVFRSL